MGAFPSSTLRGGYRRLHPSGDSETLGEVASVSWMSFTPKEVLKEAAHSKEG